MPPIKDTFTPATMDDMAHVFTRRIFHRCSKKGRVGFDTFSMKFYCDRCASVWREELVAKQDVEWLADRFEVHSVAWDDDEEVRYRLVEKVSGKTAYYGLEEIPRPPPPPQDDGGNGVTYGFYSGNYKLP